MKARIVLAAVILCLVVVATASSVYMFHPQATTTQNTTQPVVMAPTCVPQTLNGRTLSPSQRMGEAVIEESC